MFVRHRNDGLQVLIQFYGAFFTPDLFFFFSFLFFITNNRISCKLCVFLAHWYTHDTSTLLTAFCYSGDDLTPLSYYVSYIGTPRWFTEKGREGCTLVHCFFFFFSLSQGNRQRPFHFYLTHERLTWVYLRIHLLTAHTTSVSPLSRSHVSLTKLGKCKC